MEEKTALGISIARDACDSSEVREPAEHGSNVIIGTAGTVSHFSGIPA